MPSEETRSRLMRKFRAETTQNLITLRTNLPLLCQANNHDTIITMFFAAHTIKGSLGMMQLLQEDWLELNEPASRLEAIIMSLRNEEILPDAALVAQLEGYVTEMEKEFSPNQQIPQ